MSTLRGELVGLTWSLKIGEGENLIETQKPAWPPPKTLETHWEGQLTPPESSIDDASPTFFEPPVPNLDNLQPSRQSESFAKVPAGDSTDSLADLESADPSEVKLLSQPLKPPDPWPPILEILPKALWLQGGSRSETLRGAGANDTLRGEGGNDGLWGSAGNDKLYGGRGRDSLYGGVGHDLLDGQEDDDRLWGEAGRDTLRGGSGDDVLRGGSDTDTLYGDSGQDHLYGDQGDDRLYGGSGEDQLSGGSGRDLLYGESGNDVLMGDSENDTLYGETGHDTLMGGDGDDFLDGGDHHDRLNGGDGNDWLLGGHGNDRLLGGQGNDRLDSGSENDTLFGGEGNDRLYGGTGNDAIDGEWGNDQLFGGSGDDALHGGDGSDRLYGESGNDRLDGGRGSDELHGGAGNDRLFGASGDDTLWGSNLYLSKRERDLLSGGSGRDTFVLGTASGHFYRNSSHGNAAESFAQIQDFEVGLDQLRLFGQRGDYFTRTRGTGKHESQLLYFDSNRSGRFDTRDNLVAVLSGVRASQVSGLFHRAQFLGGIMPVLNRPSQPQFRAPSFVYPALDRGVSQKSKTVTVSFDRYESALLSDEKRVRSLSEMGQNEMRQILAHVSELTTLHFKEVRGQKADLMVVQAQLGAYSGRAHYPRKEGGSNLYLDQEYATTSQLQAGAYGRKVLLHELGHVLGLKHPHEDYALPGTYDSFNHTVMSYRYPTVHHVAGNVVGRIPSNFPITFQLFDIAALQAKYGTNTSTRSGNTTYLVDPSRAVVSTIWDAGGTDWMQIQARTSSYNLTFSPAVIDLREGPSFVTKVGKAAHWIAYGANLEHARGGPGNDRLYGNFRDNHLVGGGGNDTLRGAELTRSGRWERDTLTGGSGKDLFILGDTQRRYYDDGRGSRPGLEDYAVITDFNPREDRLLLHGKSSHYLLGNASTYGMSGKTVVFDSNRNRVLDPTDELMAVVQSASSLNFSNTLGATSLALYV